MLRSAALDNVNLSKQLKNNRDKAAAFKMTAVLASHVQFININAFLAC